MVIGVIDHWYYVKTQINLDNFFFDQNYIYIENEIIYIH